MESEVYDEYESAKLQIFTADFKPAKFRVPFEKSEDYAPFHPVFMTSLLN
jgi:hypothetical protein